MWWGLHNKTLQKWKMERMSEDVIIHGIIPEYKYTSCLLQSTTSGSNLEGNGVHAVHITHLTLYTSIALSLSLSFFLSLSLCPMCKLLREHPDFLWGNLDKHKNGISAIQGNSEALDLDSGTFRTKLLS